MLTMQEMDQERLRLADQWAKYTANDLLASQKRKGIGYTFSLYYSMRHMVYGGDDMRIRHMFNATGKFSDMGVGNGTKLESVSGNGDLIKLLGKSYEGRKPKKWFSPTYFRETVILENLLSEKYGEQACGLIIETLKTI